MGKQVTERAIPVAVFNADAALRLVYLRKWLEDRSLHSAGACRRVLLASLRQVCACVCVCAPNQTLA